MTGQEKEIAVQTVKNILHVLHEKRYEDLPSCVDEMERDDTEERTGTDLSHDRPGITAEAIQNNFQWTGEICAPAAALPREARQWMERNPRL